MKIELKKTQKKNVLTFVWSEIWKMFRIIVRFLAEELQGFAEERKLSVEIVDFSIKFICF